MSFKFPEPKKLLPISINDLRYSNINGDLLGVLVSKKDVLKLFDIVEEKVNQ